MYYYYYYHIIIVVVVAVVVVITIIIIKMKSVFFLVLCHNKICNSKLLKLKKYSKSHDKSLSIQNIVQNESN